MNGKSGVWIMCVALTAVFAAAVFLNGCAWRPVSGPQLADLEEATSSRSLPPLVVDASEPLLLDEPAENEASTPEPSLHKVADNTTCFVCHANYMEESMVTSHTPEGVGCAICHGESIAHKNDENNTTPPDRMFPAEKIGESCGQCHRTHDAPAAKVIARWRERCPEKTDPASIVCTDCHGEHRLKIRTVRWDKETGKLLGTLKKVSPGRDDRQ